MYILKNYIKNISADVLLFFFLVLTFCFLPIRTTLPLIAIGCATLVWLISGKVFTCKIYKQRWFFPAIFFVILPWIGLLYSKDLDLGIDYALKTKYWIAAFLTAGVIYSEKRMKIFLSFFWFSLFCGSLLAFLQFNELIPLPKGDFFLGFGLVYTVLSMYLIIGILTASNNFKVCTGKIEKCGMLLLIIAFLFHLIILNGRNGYFVLLLVSPFIVHNLTSKFPLIMKGVAFLIIIGALTISPIVQQRAKMTLEHLKRTDVILEGKFDPKFPRPFMFHQTFKMIAQSPIIGIGTGSLKYYTEKTGHVVNHPHNSILYMFVSFGVLGLVSFFWLFGSMFLISYKNKDKPLGYLVFSICIVVFLGGFFDTLIINSGTSLLLPMGYGMLNHLEGEKIFFKKT